MVVICLCRILRQQESRCRGELGAGVAARRRVTGETERRLCRESLAFDIWSQGTVLPLERASQAGAELMLCPMFAGGQNRLIVEAQNNMPSS